MRRRGIAGSHPTSFSFYYESCPCPSACTLVYLSLGPVSALGPSLDSTGLRPRSPGPARRGPVWFLLGREESWAPPPSSSRLLRPSPSLAPSRVLGAGGAPSRAPLSSLPPPRSLGDFTWLAPKSRNPVSVMAASSHPLPGTQAGPSKSPPTAPSRAVMGNSDATGTHRSSGFLPLHRQPSRVQLLATSPCQLL